MEIIALRNRAYDEIWRDGPRFTASDKVFGMSTDSVLLSHFARTKGALLGCDLGCGGGLIGVLMCHANAQLVIHGVEIDPYATEIGRKNAIINNLEERLLIFNQDIRATTLIAGGYDIAVSTPPYFPTGSGKEHSSLSSARSEGICTLEDVCSCASRLLRWGGKLFMVHKPERLTDVFRAMSAAAIEPKRLQLIQHKSDSAPGLILVEGRRGGNPGLRIDAPIIMVNSNGEDSDIIREIYHRT